MRISYRQPVFCLTTIFIISLLAIAYAKSNSVQDGVNLLEEILQKMHDMPQIALSNKGQLVRAQLLADSTTQNNFDYLNNARERAQYMPAPIPMVKDKGTVQSSDFQNENNLPRPAPSAATIASAPSNVRLSYAPREHQVTAAQDRFLMRDFSPFPSSGVGAIVERRRAENTDVLSLAKQKENILPNSNLALALSPPAVITGISLVKLGSSEKEVNAAISHLGKVRKDLFHGWSIWSLQKTNNPDYSIQIFMRHGAVDAIRVFDKSFLRSDMGISPGDELSNMKTKFGEPAFILTDKETITSQNYIYPISQVGFQLSRPEKNQVPKIVSMLIFNVK